MSDQPVVFVHLLPSLIPPGALKGGVAVAVDVLRATTAMSHALAAGCEAIIPCAEIDDARQAAASLPAATALLGGERGGLAIPGFDLGNSPGDYTPARCAGRTLVMTTTNGTRAILASLDAEQVLIGAFVNLDATARAARESGVPVHVVCAGTEGIISWEDTLCAGAIVERLGAAAANDEARIAREAWAALRKSRALDDEALGRDLVAWLREGRGGRNIHRIGLHADIPFAAELNRFDFAPKLERDPLRITRAGR